MTPDARRHRRLRPDRAQAGARPWADAAGSSAVADARPGRARGAGRPSIRGLRGRRRTGARAVERADVDVVVVATTNDALAPVDARGGRAGKHVLVEKPAARTRGRAGAGARRGRARPGVIVQGRLQPPLPPRAPQARELVDEGALGPLLYVRGRYGHGGRLGYEREWRADPDVAGGGELLDQGVHLIDLARWFAGDFVERRPAHWPTFFWDMPVEDNGFLLLRTAAGQVAWLHASCTEWKNLFSFEIFGRDGKLQIDGLGGSYGVERLTFYRMLPEMGPPETTDLGVSRRGRSPGAPSSSDFVERRRAASRPPRAALEDALAALAIVERVYAGDAGR